MDNKKIVAAVVVLYEPRISNLKNLLKILKLVDHVFVVDNSEIKSVRIQNRERITYIKLGSNMGLGAALNIGMRGAVNGGFEYALTLDQDSCFSTSGVSELISEYCSVFECDKTIAVMAPITNETINIRKKVKVVITSGSLISIKQIGNQQFEEKLFIDAVDYEFCLRINNLGYSIYQTPYVKLEHKIGNENKPFYLDFTHGPSRRYYMVRNSLYLWTRYFKTDPLFILVLVIRFMRNVIEIFLYSKEKFAELKAVRSGVKDFLRGVYGKKK